MTDLPDIVKRAAGLHGAIASDLSLFGGVLRCLKCGREQSLGDVGGHLGHGWPKCCGYTMSWVTLKQIAAEGWDVPDDCELVSVPSENWRLATGKRCRAGAGPGRSACGRPSVAELCRYPSTRPELHWAYCLDHLYGNWIENGQFMHWVLREKGRSGG